MTMVELTQEEMDCVNYDARDGDLDTLKEIFAEIGGPALLTIKDDQTLSTPVHMAAGNGHLEVVEYLLSLLSPEEAKKLVKQTNDSGNTPLHWAAFAGHLPVVKALIEKYGADPFQKNDQGHDAIYEAEDNNQEDVETWLLQNFAVEETIKIEDHGEDTKITYTPGQESYEQDKLAREAQEEAEREKRKREDGESSLEESTQKLSLN
ncbi:ankyrin repeat-containing protein Yar1p [Diutina catenulata]